ncbi:MAG: hypothetical protein AMJ95_13275 [Omnitrophica WOR_2 bacterium SM23_72]|nr:MAG: hypothetical protein AMJ95_13275 [Omnitrophica WOR_2 bacterium SM23_72]
MEYHPKDYWEERLSKNFALAGAGHLSFNEYYNRWLYRAKVRALKKALSTQKIDILGKAVCDIGCGTGFFVDFYKCLGAKDIVGIDITHVSIEKLKSRYPEYVFVEGDIASVSITSKMNRKFNILNIFDVLYHIKDDEGFIQAIKNISELAQDEGYIFISDLFRAQDIDLSPYITFRSKKTYEAAFRDSGLKVITTYPLYYYLNRTVSGKILNRLFSGQSFAVDNLFAPLYYLLDGVVLSERKNNLNLIVAEKA